MTDQTHVNKSSLLEVLVGIVCALGITVSLFFIPGIIKLDWNMNIPITLEGRVTSATSVVDPQGNARYFISLDTIDKYMLGTLIYIQLQKVDQIATTNGGDIVKIFGKLELIEGQWTIVVDRVDHIYTSQHQRDERVNQGLSSYNLVAGKEDPATLLL